VRPILDACANDNRCGPKGDGAAIRGALHPLRLPERCECLGDHGRESWVGGACGNEALSWLASRLLKRRLRSSGSDDADSKTDEIEHEQAGGCQCRGRLKADHIPDVSHGLGNPARRARRFRQSQLDQRNQALDVPYGNLAPELT
jgi:hypothetical protein